MIVYIFHIRIISSKIVKNFNSNDLFHIIFKLIKFQIIFIKSKINNIEIAVPCGNELLIIDDINKKANLSQIIFDAYPFLMGHTKSVLFLFILWSENKPLKI